LRILLFLEICPLFFGKCLRSFLSGGCSFPDEGKKLDVCLDGGGGFGGVVGLGNESAKNIESGRS
jgi:hypothetical protein